MRLNMIGAKRCAHNNKRLIILHLAHTRPPEMCFAVSKGWLPSDVQSFVWYYAFVAPTAEAIKGVTIESEERRHWTLKSLKTKAPLHILHAMGRSVVNHALPAGSQTRLAWGITAVNAVLDRP